MVALVIFGLLVTACGAPPPLKSETYLDDTSLVTGPDTCAPPCFRGIVVGKTTFTDALSKVKADAGFASVQSQDKPPAAAWAAAGGDACCQMTANQDTGLIDAMLVKVKPRMTVAQVIGKYGKPGYTTVVDYTPEEVAIGLIFPKVGLVTWVTPGDANSTLKQSDPVVIVLYLDPKDFGKLLDTSTLLGWNGFLPYQTYKNATPVVTPRVTLTPSSQ
jgi:hypothetical protein